MKLTKFAPVGLLAALAVGLAACNGSSTSSSPTSSQNTTGAPIAAHNPQTLFAPSKCLTGSFSESPNAWSYNPVLTITNSCSSSQDWSNQTVVFTSQEVNGTSAMPDSNALYMGWSTSYPMIFTKGSNNQISGTVNLTGAQIPASSSQVFNGTMSTDGSPFDINTANSTLTIMDASIPSQGNLDITVDTSESNICVGNNCGSVTVNVTNSNGILVESFPASVGSIYHQPITGLNEGTYTVSSSALNGSTVNYLPSANINVVGESTTSMSVVYKPLGANGNAIINLANSVPAYTESVQVQIINVADNNSVVGTYSVYQGSPFTTDQILVSDESHQYVVKMLTGIADPAAKDGVGNLAGQFYLESGLPPLSIIQDSTSSVDIRMYQSTLPLHTVNLAISGLTSGDKANVTFSDAVSKYRYVNPKNVNNGTTPYQFENNLHLGVSTQAGGTNYQVNPINTTQVINSDTTINQSFIISPSHVVTAYLLFSDDSTISYMQSLPQQIASGAVKLNRLVISFVDPNFNIESYNATNGDLTQLLVTSGILPSASGNDGANLQQAITALKAQGVSVYFAVGGWANSCLDPQIGQTSSCTKNFPLTQDMVSNFKNILPGSTYTALFGNNPDTSSFAKKVQKPVDDTTSNYTNAWSQLVNAFGGSGVDLDYEEMWFASETTYQFGNYFLALQNYAGPPDGPFTIPLSVVKYGTYLKELEISSTAHGLGQPTAAAPAVGAYNIHQQVGGAMYWCPVQNSSGKSICGSGSGTLAKIGGNLKGTFYDMAHYLDSDVNQVISNGSKLSLSLGGALDSNSKPLFESVLVGMDSINPMTYDLDDGYDTVSGSWCIGMVANGTNGALNYSSRDPGTDGYKTVDCALDSQVAIITSMFKANVMPFADPKTHLAFGLEAGFPNYPINISSDLPGGGESAGAQADMHYRWNDLFVAFDLPLYGIAQSESTLAAFKANNASQTSDVSSGTPDVHSSYLIVNNALFKQMESAGADSLIVWSLENEDYNDHLSKTISWDYQQYQALIALESVPTSYSAFGNYKYSSGSLTTYTYYYFNYLGTSGTNSNLLNTIFNKSATPEEMVNTASSYWGI